MHRVLVPLITLSLILTACGTDEGVDDTASTDETSEPAADPATGTTTATVSNTSEPDSESGSEAGSEELFPDVVGVEAEADGDGSWTFAVTLSSPYDSPERYADAWRVVGPDGTVFGERVLAHDHAGEQPFTRSQSGIEIPDDVTSVTVEGRDQVSGWGGATMDVTLDR